MIQTKLFIEINFIEIAFRHGCSPVNLLHIFRTLFPRNTSGWLLLETPMKSSDFDFDNVDGMYYKCHRSLRYGGLCIDSSDWIRNKKTTINPKINDDNCFQYAVTVALNHENIENLPKI